MATPILLKADITQLKRKYVRLDYVRKDDKINVLNESTLVRYERNGEITNYII